MIVGLMFRRMMALTALLLVLPSACRDAADGGQAAADVEWPLHGHTETAQRFADLDQIDRETVSRLDLAWSFDLETDRGQEATPIMVDGVLYVVSAYDVVSAIDARTGKGLWTYDPEVRAASARSCCGPVSRGVAVAQGRVYVGALDGRLIALDAKSGKPVWETQTIDQSGPFAVNYTITGAPRFIKGNVVIGNGGAEFGVRGYVSAYDAATGKLAWRFYTVPGKPGTKDNAASDAVLAKAQGSWAGQWWRYGGGGTVWDAIEYDPALDLIYIGTGNGSPWNHQMRSDGKGDNLFLSSIVALRASTGDYVWHFQQVPGDAWDYTATQNIVLADMEIDGKPRKVLMQAPKNGFFYILDRATGEFLNATAYVPQNWAKSIDPKTGRPDIVPEARYYRTGKPHFQFPSSGGGHNWPPMAFSPRTGLVYIPAQDVGMPFGPNPQEAQVIGAYTSGVAMSGGGAMSAADRKALYDSMKARLIAWDPIARKPRWTSEEAAPFNGGVLATAGGLVFAGNAQGRLVAYDDESGKRLWSFEAQTGIVAPPISYRLDGVQYIAVMAGWGGGWPLTGGVMALKAGKTIGPNRLLVFKLDGAAKLPAFTPAEPLPFPDVVDKGTPAQIAQGDGLFGRFCLRCHGSGAVSAGAYPDLRRTGLLGTKGFSQVVLGGALAEMGMPSFAGHLTPAQVDAIDAYLVRRSLEDRRIETQEGRKQKR
ncbi:PQQ-dependent dehydrogenase, methanol/ethanol family [Sphingobium sp. B11D3D]|uniref:PQQ-dependent dehydrogenase, methanol/ethanol family n=1 Tax=Sphingobium sp. B11D3D TaxID=2940576 RepID=UPI002224F03B|nr:PQQ-dependent dehydrogenase, methanol/ethanol family [Sphingobium sp. B11D3D]MCW2369039.1 alcohol dehydrogenase (cytochrome c)/quinohemoprotein ethanol dehydrogenase [Sphingobium sp. B11D3D]